MPIPKPADNAGNNRILAALPAGELEKLEAALEHVELDGGQVLWETDEKGEHLYFPTTSLVSLVYANENGTSISVATLGRSSVVGAAMVGAHVRTPDRAVVTFSGHAYRMQVSHANSELAECGDFHTLLLVYSNSLMIHISQNAICNRLHRIDQQLCRWLLGCFDELLTDSLSITHDQIAAILGVRRESISLALSQLQKSRLIKTSRGKIRMLNPERMADAACECYSVVKDHQERALKKYAEEHSS
jgi:CRP-like cAMP-binding protein